MSFLATMIGSIVAGIEKSPVAANYWGFPVSHIILATDLCVYAIMLTDGWLTKIIGNTT